MNASGKSAMQTAEEAISLIHATRSQLARMVDLVSAIRADAAQGLTLNLEALSYIAQNLGQEWGEHLDAQVEALQHQLETAPSEA